MSPRQKAEFESYLEELFSILNMARMQGRELFTWELRAVKEYLESAHYWLEGIQPWVDRSDQLETNQTP